MGDFRPQLFFAEISLFLVVQLLGLWAGISTFEQYIKLTGEAPVQMETGFSIMWFLGAFLIATALIIVFLKYIKKPIIFSGLFYFLIFIGSEAVFEVALLPLAERGLIPQLPIDFPSIAIYAIVLSAIIVGLRILRPNVITQNVAIILAVSGIGATLGLVLPVIAIIVLLLILSVYDFIAVFKTKHMVKMFSSLMQKGTPLAIIIPEKISHMGASVGHVVKEKLRPGTSAKRNFVMLGTGDLVFPIILSVSVYAQFSLIHALAVVVGSLIGIAIIHLLLTKKRFKALPALPPITAGALIGLGIAWLLIDYLKIIII